MRLTRPSHVFLGLFTLGAIAFVAGCSPSIADTAAGGHGGSGHGSGAGSAGSAPTSCGGVLCPSGQICCFANATCFDPALGASSCTPSIAGAGGGGGIGTGAGPSGSSSSGGSQTGACNSNLDCASGQFCYGYTCGGPGMCGGADACGESEGDLHYCGCDGKQYAQVQDACAAGVRIAGEGKCGHHAPDEPPTHVMCALDVNCPDGFHCCGLTDRCFDPTKPDNCAVPPDGTKYPCTDDSDCPGSFCYAPKCGGPKGCYVGDHPHCTSLDAPVCGCDDKTYLNSSCALAHHVAVAHDFKCK